MRSLLPCLGLLVACQAAPPVAPTPVAPDPRVAWEAQRRHLERLRGGVEHFVELATTRPEFAAVALQAASDAITFCERGRPDLSCAPALLEELADTMRRHHAVLSPTRGWVVEARDASCEALAAELTKRGAPGGPLRLTLERCSFTASHGPWVASQCISNGYSCPDGSQPGYRLGPNAVARTCPCLSASRTTRYEVQGRWQDEGRSAPFLQQGGGESGEVTEERAPRELTDGDPRALAIDELELSLLRTATALSTHRAAGPDELALACARVGQVDRGSTWGVTTPCAAAFEREPRPPVARAPHVVAPPSLDTSSYPWRLALRDAPTRRADAEALSLAHPGWRFTVGATGFIMSAQLVRAPDTVEALGAAARELMARSHVQLGFTTPPQLTTRGEQVFVGDGSEPLELRRCASCAGFEAALVSQREPLHRWPAPCPAADEARLLAKWLGRKVTRETPGMPCDPGRGVRCKSTPPRTETVKLTRAMLVVRPVVVLTRSSKTEALAHCALELSGVGGVLLGEVVPGSLDVVTGEPLAALREAELD